MQKALTNKCKGMKKCNWRKHKFWRFSFSVCQVRNVGRLERTITSILQIRHANGVLRYFLWETTRREGSTLGVSGESLLRFVSGRSAQRSGWERQMGSWDGPSGSAAILDKMLTVWNHIKGWDVGESVYGLVQIQNVLWGFVSVRLIESLSLCVSNHCGLTKVRWICLQLNCVLCTGGKALGMPWL